LPYWCYNKYTFKNTTQALCPVSLAAACTPPLRSSGCKGLKRQRLPAGPSPKHRPTCYQRSDDRLRLASVSFGLLLSVLVGFGQLWSALVSFGRLWSALVGFGRRWSALVGFGWLWPALVGFARLWLGSAGFGRLRSALVGFDPLHR